MHVTITYWSCTLNFVCACVRWLYSFHGACSFNDCAIRYVFARCARVCVSVWLLLLFSSPLFTFVILNFPSFSFVLYIAAVHGVQPATSRTFEYRIPYKRWVVLRSNHQFLVHPPVFNTSYSIFIRKSSQTKKTSSQNVQIGEYQCKVFVQIHNSIKKCSLDFSRSFLLVKWIFAILVRNCLCFGRRQCCTRSDCITCSSSGCPSSCGCTHRACCPSCR